MSSAQDDPPVPGGSLSVENKVLASGAGMTQDFAPIKNICAHLNAFHTYADEPGRCVEANHYCSHVSEGKHASSAHNPRA